MATLKKSSSLLELEKLLKRVRTETLFKLPNSFDGDLLADIWASIVIGTAYHNNIDVTSIASGITEPSDAAHFYENIHGITALQLSKVKTKFLDRIDAEEIEYQVSVAQAGTLDPTSSTSRTLVEFDPQRPVAVQLQAPQRRDRDLLLLDLIKKFRVQLQVDLERQGINPAAVGPANDIITIAAELHSNARQYAVPTHELYEGSKGLRLLRMRRHVANSYEALISRVSDGSPLHDYVTSLQHRDMNASGTRGIMELCVSDFGPGILGHFLNSARGQQFKTTSRRDVLVDLLHNSLSSSSNPSAGHGIPKALLAARSMSAFASVRTNEFWLCRSFAQEGTNFALSDALKTDLARISGTHWQFFWPMDL